MAGVGLGWRLPNRPRSHVYALPAAVPARFWFTLPKAHLERRAKHESAWKGMKPPIGTLVKLRKWNAWIIISLAISGIVLRRSCSENERAWPSKTTYGRCPRFDIIGSLPSLHEEAFETNCHKTGAGNYLSVVLFLLVG